MQDLAVHIEITPLSGRVLASGGAPILLEILGRCNHTFLFYAFAVLGNSGGMYKSTNRPFYFFKVGQHLGIFLIQKMYHYFILFCAVSPPTQKYI